MRYTLRACILHDLGNDVVLGLSRRCASAMECVDVTVAGEALQSSLTSMSSRLSCWPMHLSTFFLLLSCISPANSSSSRMK